MSDKEALLRIQRDLDKTERELRYEPFDLNDPKSLHEKNRQMDELFDSRVGMLRNSEPYDGDRGYRMIKRRKEALGNLFAEAYERFGEKYPQLCIADEMMRFNAPLGTVTFQSLEREYDPRLAAAIWILDYLKISDQYEEAVAVFPTTREELDSVYLPYLSDSVHSDDELRMMLYILGSGERGMSGSSENAPKEEDRKRFETITALIDPEIRRELQEEFISQLWELFDSLLSLTAKHRAAISQKTDALRAMLPELIEQSGSAQDGSVMTVTVSGSADQLQSIVADSAVPDTGHGIKEVERMAQELRQDELSLRAVYDNILMLPDWVNGDIPSDRDLELYADLKVPKIRNPYDSCFAFMTLLDEDSDYVWLYNLCCDLVAFAGQALPWADTNVVDPDGELGELQIDFPYLRSLVRKEPDWSEDDSSDRLYDMCIPSPLLKEKRLNTSIAKLTFLTSGLIPPRAAVSISFTRALLGETDFSPQTRDMLYNYFALAYSVNHRDMYIRNPEDEPVSDPSPEEKDEVKDKEIEIKKLRAKIKHLKNIINQAEHKNKDLSYALDETGRQLKSTNAELAELRSMIRESCEAEEEAPTTVPFPYTVRQRTVVIGGRDSWVKAIRPLLNNVRYIGPSENPNSAVIFNADVVWIQSNAMAHSSFYKVIDIIRKNDIKVCYFKYSSAEKCAEQLALEEMESPGDDQS